MVAADIGGEGQKWVQNIGSIKTPTQSGFDNSQIDACPAKMIKG